jgi:thiamine biosynthesis protein ThiI
VSSCVVVHYHEISLKGGNRPLFLRRLGRNLLQATAGCGVRGVRRLPGRLVLDLEPGADLEAIRERVATVFGIAYFAPALSLPPDSFFSSSRDGASSRSGSRRAGRSRSSRCSRTR